MPELPEVETIVKDLQKKILGEKILNIEIFDQKVWRGEFSSDFLCNKKITKISRRGKFIVLNIDKKYFLLVHLRMTGRILFFQEKKLKKNFSTQFSKSESQQQFKQKNKNDQNLQHLEYKKIQKSFIRAIIFLENKNVLIFSDVRKFGFLQILNKSDFENFSQNWGIEPFDKNFSFTIFQKKLSPKKNIKNFLLDQKSIAGIGNIYADEILFEAKISPLNKIQDLDKKNLKKLFFAIPKILDLAIKNRGTTFDSFRDANGLKGKFQNFLKVYGRAGKKCKICNNILEKIRVSGRGTVFCRNCQK